MRGGSAARDLERARTMIDRWVQTRPPPLHTARHFRAGDVKHLSTVRTPFAKLLYGAALSAAGDAPMTLRTPEESKAMDEAFFDGRRMALLDEADALLRTLFNERRGTLPVESLASIRVALAYARTQRLLWLTHIGKLPLPDSPWAAHAHPDWKAIEDLVPKDVPLPSSMPAERWLDDTIRLGFSRGQSLINRGEVGGGLHNLADAISWCASAQNMGQSLGPARTRDWLDALYAILDHLPGEDADERAWASSEHWFGHASLLIKDIRIGLDRRVQPPMLFSLKSNGDISFAHDGFYGSDEWQAGFAALPAETALLDLIVTDRFLHARFKSQHDSANYRWEINRLLAEGRGGQWLSPEGAVLEPRLAVPGEQAATGDPQAAEPQSAARQADLDWMTHYRVMNVYWDELSGEFDWRFEWVPTAMAAGAIWRAIYDVVLAPSVERCARTGISHLVIIPDGGFTAVPHHLLPDPDGQRLGDKLAISYLPHLGGVVTALDRDKISPDRMTAVLVADPSHTVALADWECDDLARQLAASAQVLRPEHPGPEDLTRACDGAGLLHFTGHAAFDWNDPDGAYLIAANGARMGLAEIEQLNFAPGALVFLSACHSGRRGNAANRTASRGLVTAMFEAGAATVICTMWPVDSIAAALVSHWFYGRWIGAGDGRLDSLRWATQRLRSADRAECEQVLGRRIYKRGERPLADESYWGAFVLYGAW